MSYEREIENIKSDYLNGFTKARQLWVIEERGADFVVHNWYGPNWSNGPGVAPPASYPTLRKAAARLLQLLGTGAVAPQTWPEKICIGEVTTDDGSKHGADSIVNK